MQNEPAQHVDGADRVAVSAANNDAPPPLSAAFLPRPVVPALALATGRYESLSSSLIRADRPPPPPPPPPPDWLHSDDEISSTLGSTPPFPIVLASSNDESRWWLGEMNDVIEMKPDQLEKSIALHHAVKSHAKERASSTRREHRHERSAYKIAELRDKISEIRSELHSMSDDAHPRERKARIEELLDEVEGGMEEASRARALELLRRVEEGALSAAADAAAAETAECNSAQNLRRVSTAITGSTLAVTGLALELLPVVPGFLVTYYGLVVLSTEFEGARELLNAVRHPIERWLDDDGDNNPLRSENGEESWKGCDSSAWEGLIGSSASSDCRNRIEDRIDGEFSKLMANAGRDDATADDGGQVQEEYRSGKADAEGKASNNRMKPFLRKVLMIDESSAKGKGGKLA